MVRKLLTRVKTFLPLIGLIILAYIVYSLGFKKITAALFSINPLYVIGALALTVPLVFFRNTAWQLILREQHITVGFFRSMKIYLIGVFYGSITPGYLGQVMRVPYLKERTGEPYGKLFSNTVVEVFVHSFSLYGMMVIGALLVSETIPALLPITIAWIVGITLVAVYLVKKERGEKLFQTMIVYLVPKAVKHHFTVFVGTFYDNYPRFHAMIAPYILGIFTWIIVFSQEYLIALALGLQIPYLAFLLLFPIANTAGFIPITFAGLGTREFTAIFIFSTLFQTPGEQILVLSLVGLLVTDLFMGFLGFVLSLTESRISIDMSGSAER